MIQAAVLTREIYFNLIHFCDKVNIFNLVNSLLKMICDRFQFFLERIDLKWVIFIFIFIDIYNNVSKFYKNLVKWALTEIEWSVAGTTTLDREWYLDIHYISI